MSLGLLYVLEMLPFDRFLFIVSTQLLSLMITAVLMFGNRMLLSSLFSTTLYAFALGSLVDSFLFPPSNRRLVVSVRRLASLSISFVVIKFVVIRFLFSSPDDDAHIWDILKSKLFPPFKTFDTQLYTCAKEFDFIDKETIWKLTSTGLLPLAFIVLLRLSIDFLRNLFGKGNDDKERVSNHYHLIQTGIYGLMGILIMRLKLFPVPQMCLLISLTMNDKLWPRRVFSNPKWKLLLFLVILLGMGIEGRKNIKAELGIRGKSIRNCLS